MNTRGKTTLQKLGAATKRTAERERSESASGNSQRGPGRPKKMARREEREEVCEEDDDESVVTTHRQPPTNKSTNKIARREEVCEEDVDVEETTRLQYPINISIRLYNGTPGEDFEQWLAEFKT